MRPISSEIKEVIRTDKYYKQCARKNDDCKGRLTMEHAFIYAGKQIDEVWAIIPLCWYHHLGDGLDKRRNELISLRRAKPDDLAKYPRRDWEQLKKYLESKYERD